MASQGNITVELRHERWPLAQVFRISRGARSESESLTLILSDGEWQGRGECCPSARYGESIDSVSQQITALEPALRAGLSRQQLADDERIGPGAARNAIDCALWDLQAKRQGIPVWQLADLPAPQPLTTAYTLGIDKPAAMAQAVDQGGHAKRPLLKLKMAGDDADLERVSAVRRAAPDAQIIVDANEAWTIERYRDLVPALAKLGVAMIEQPFPAGQDEVLAMLARPVPVCADESCHSREQLPALRERYDMINIKLDKTGGLSEALALKQDALAAGLQIMVGCMVGTSLAMAPAFLVAQQARFVDIDGPLLLRADRQPGLQFDGSQVAPPDAALWG